MYDVVSVHIVQSHQDLLQDNGSLLLVKVASCVLQLVVQLTAAEELSYYVIILVIFQKSSDLHDIGMAQIMKQLQLINQKLIEHLLLLNLLLKNNFYGTFLACQKVLAFIHSSVLPLTQQLLEVVKLIDVFYYFKVLVVFHIFYS